MSRKIVFGFCIVAALAAAGCATRYYGTVLPKGDGTYTVVTKAATERNALKMAQLDAEATCKKHSGRKEFVALQHASQDVGPQLGGTDSGGATGLAASMLEQVARANNTENFKVEMQFRCAA